MTRRHLFWLAQAALAIAIGVFIWRSLAANWESFRNLQFDFALHPGWILLSAGTVLATYALLIEAWRRVLGGWGESLPYPTAVRIWTLSNLGRYLPGKIWSIAGLAVLAQRQGVSGWAAAGSAVVMQAMAVGTGVAVAAATVPAAGSPLWPAIGGGIAALVVVLLTSSRSVGLASRVFRRELRPLRLPDVAAAGVATLLSWATYGGAFWLLARGLFGDTGLSPFTAVGVFAAGYITGLVAVFAPGGAVVRETVFIGLLTPALGSGGAVVLGLASRILLTMTETGAAAVGALLRGRAPGPPHGAA